MAGVEDTSFYSANLENSDLSYGSFIEVCFDSADMTNSRIFEASFVKTSFEDADLVGVDFHKAESVNEEEKGEEWEDEA